MKSFLLITRFVILSLNCIIINSSCHSLFNKDGLTFDKKPALKKDIAANLPNPLGYVNDYDNIFTPQEKYKMDSLLYNFEVSDSIQLLIVAFDTAQTSRDQISVATKSIIAGWKPGGNSDRGIVIGISKYYKQMKIENGYGIVKLLSHDDIVNTVTTICIPYFRQNEYFKGTWDAIRILILKLRQKK